MKLGKYELIIRRTRKVPIENFRTKKEFLKFVRDKVRWSRLSELTLKAHEDYLEVVEYPYN